MKKLLLSPTILATVCFLSKAKIFSQNFTSTNVAVYFNTTNPNQFTNISAVGSSSVTASTGS